MTKKAAAVVAVLALGVAAPAAYATYALSGELLAYIAKVPPTNDFAVGEGKFVKGRSVEQFTLASQGSLIDASGSVRLRSQTFSQFGDIKGKVTCLLVQGNRAGISGNVQNPPPGAQPVFVVAVEDNGEPGSAVPDRAIFALIDVPPVEGDCGLSFLIDPGAGPIVQGNVVVKDR
jgi:hypothetical protein